MVSNRNGCEQAGSEDSSRHDRVIGLYNYRRTLGFSSSLAQDGSVLVRLRGINRSEPTCRMRCSLLDSQRGMISVQTNPSIGRVIKQRPAYLVQSRSPRAVSRARMRSVRRDKTSYYNSSFLGSWLQVYCHEYFEHDLMLRAPVQLFTFKSQ